MKSVNGIQTPFDNAAFTPPGVNEQAGGGTKGGVDIRDGEKQSSAGETGMWTTTADLPNQGGDGGPGLKRPSGMAGS